MSAGVAVFLDMFPAQPRRPMIFRFLLLLLLLVAPLQSRAQSVKPPKVDAAAEARAARVSSMPDGDPVARLNQVLEASDLDDAALFALASTNPGVVEQVIDEDLKMAIDYLKILPGADLHRVRRGETVIRTVREIRHEELTQVEVMTDHFGFKLKKLDAVQAGPLEARVFRLEVRVRKGKEDQQIGAFELAWPSTPERDEKSRTVLAKHFGARPSRTGSGAGALIPLKFGSFESQDALTTGWQVVDGRVFGVRTPEGEAYVDQKVAVDGQRSLLFYNTIKTRWFPMVVQEVPVTPGSVIRARVMHRAENLRIEFQQTETDVFVGLTFLDGNGSPLGPMRKVNGRLTTHAWELLELQDTVPAGAVKVQLAMMSAVSGTSWFDGATVEVIR